MSHSVSILCHTLSGNAFGRAWLLAELLRADFAVHIVTACRPDDQLWLPARGQCDFEIRRWTSWSYPGFLARAPSIARALVTGDVIYSVKPHLTSLGLGFAARRERQRPLIADVDDWELGFSSLAKDVLGAPWAMLSAASSLHTRLLSGRVRSADAVTVSSSFLHAQYGGTWIPHARAEPPVDATPAAQPASVPTVVFVGTPRKHKGLHVLLTAFRALRVPARLRIIGGAMDAGLVREHQAHPDARIQIEPPVPMQELFAILKASDVVVIPQGQSPASRGQLPAKLLDAMAAGKAIVATDVGDIPRWLAEDAGVVVPPDDAIALCEALSRLLLDPTRRAQLGARALARFRALGSFDVVRPRLVSLVESVRSGMPLPTASAPFAG